MEIDSPVDRFRPPAISLEAGPSIGKGRLFLGPDGLRLGWRLLLFTGLWLLLKFRFVIQMRRLLILFVLPAETRQLIQTGMAGGEDSACSAMLDFVDFGALMALFWVMSKVERRSISSYGLPLGRAGVRRLGEGTLLGLGAMSLVLLGMKALGGFELGAVLLSASDAVRSGLLWAIALLAVALFEEALFRGYILQGLAAAIRFWPAAVLLSALFAAAHVGNPGENLIGLCAVFAFGMLFCLFVRRTGSLWLAVGFHIGWDWAESFLFGVPDSGVVSRGRLLAPVLHGPARLTGGTVGPEGSMLTAIVLLMVAVLVACRVTRTSMQLISGENESD